MNPASRIRSAVALVSLLFVILFSTVRNDARPATWSTPEVRVIVLEGTPYNRGLMHGRALKKEINEVIRKWKAHVESDYKMAADLFIDRFLKETNFLPAIKRWTPDLLDEVKGIADGSGVVFNAILLIQLGDEEWVNAQYIAPEHCSGLGVNRQGARPAMVAQNMDIEGFYNPYQVVLQIKHKDSDLQSLVFTCAGMLGLNGMNNRSIGVCVNTLSQLSHAKEGLPVTFVIRGLLEQRTQKDAIRFLHQVKHASGQNYIIGGPEKVYDFEASSNKVVEYRPSKDSQVVYHTNHALANDDMNAEFRARFAKLEASKRRTGNTFSRFESLEKRLSGDTVSVNAETFKAALRSHDSEKDPVCVPYRDEKRVMTFGSVIMILSAKPELLVTAGPPDKSDYTTVSFAGRAEVAKK
ncbi:MAG TPA: C45 family peptidase [Blastocatellia bacterium]|nr:C45 family peptidase [Blastocatellia bacterium]